MAATRASSSNGCLRWVSYWMARLSATITASPGLAHHRIVNALLSECEWEGSLKQLRTCLTKTSPNVPTVHFRVTFNTRNVSTKYFYTSPDNITVVIYVKFVVIILIIMKSYVDNFAWSLHSTCGNLGLTHWGRVTHICVGKLTITGSDNSLSPGRHQAIIWTNAGMLLVGTLGPNLSEILIGI